ncbi:MULTISPECIES: hypothetical protein [unclassified Acinetobacter]|uniref:hypothetical protein n=1 Tax=unclassified Acinetobacter TaxID=196816 RepID=UPI002934D26C|nr:MULTISPECIES: hypothetical protein [unclassified Acinetobacter]WOE32161.1 hypothetical protein QSG84_02805 [Acinetobacter sp. SAAs470]WOE37631.1 hypothetical protein QSG86_11850 [Acinetobacter sp. SAAs474]
MVDRVEINKNIKTLSDEIEKWQNLSRGLMTRDEMIVIDGKITAFKNRIKNLRVMLNGN